MLHALSPARALVLKILLRLLWVSGVSALVLSSALSPKGALAVLGVVALLTAVGLVIMSRRDGAALLTLLVLLLFLIPQDYVLVGPLKSVGNPAVLFGMGLLALWAAGRILGLILAEEDHPARWLLLAYALVGLTSFAAAMMRTLTMEESAGATRNIFPTLAFLGVGLMAVDGLGGTVRTRLVLERLTMVAGAAAVLGIIEFALGFSYRDVMKPPGLTTNTELIDATRSGFSRVDVASSHPIEYAVVLGALAPLALHFAMHTGKSRRRWVFIGCFITMACVIPMTVSRSGILAVVVGLGVYAVHLSTRARANLLVLGVLGIAVFRAAVPGLLGTLKSLLLIGEEDPSIAGRTQDYALVPGLMEGHWVFGRGSGTFQPTLYFYVDNQYLGSLLDAGLVGLAVLVSLFVVGMGLGRGLRRRSTSTEMRGLGQALTASIAALAVAALTFDELAFRQTAFTLFLLIGCAGALWSEARGPRPARPDAEAGLESGLDVAAVGGSR